MPNATFPKTLRRLALLAGLLLILPVLARVSRAQGVRPAPPRAFSPGGEATLEADQQREVGKTFYADGHVDVRYENARLRADHVEYDSETQVVIARGHVQLDYLTQHVEADDARYELRTGRGTFHHVHGTFALQRRPQPTLLVSPNPLYFEAEEAERLDQNTYRIYKAWMTVCDPGHPVWKFYAPSATVRLQKSVRLVNGNFRVFSIPVLYLPYATLPAEKRRESGFLVPDLGNTSQKGYVLGDSVYWAPLDWLDMTLGANDYTKRGWSQRGEFRMKPWENANFEASYFGVIDRGLEQVDAPPIKQGGHEAKLLFTSELPGGWRAVADLDQLTSLTFRLAWSETFAQAVNSEVHNTAFLANNFDGFSLGLAALSYQNYLSATPQLSITLRTAPELRFSSVDQQFFKRLPFYFSFDAFTGAEHRGENITPFETPGFVERSEIAPTVTMPLHFGDWLNVTPSFTFRSTYYGGQLENGAFVNEGLFRNTEEFSLDMRFPILERVWDGGDTKWKHVIEPYAVYSYVSGVNDFGRFVRFDEDETLTNTNDFVYSVTQRLYHRAGEGQADNVVTWRIMQAYYFDPTFGGALTPGTRNVFQALDSITPFAFANEPRHFSPINSDLVIMPGGRYDAEVRLDYDTVRHRITTAETLLKIRATEKFNFTVAQFSIDNTAGPPPNNAVLQPPANQIRTQVGYGESNRRGWSTQAGVGYDVKQNVLQNEFVEVSYNGSCCGLSVEYRRLSLGEIRTENQFRVSLNIANIGTFGNLRRQDKIF